MGDAPLPALPSWRLLRNSQTASWHMPKACSAPRRGQPLMRTPKPWQPGQVGALELGSQVPVHSSSCFLSGAFRTRLSRSSTPGQRGQCRGGHPCPPKSTLAQCSLRSTGAQGRDRQAAPASSPPRPYGEGLRHRQPGVVLPVCTPPLGCHSTRPKSVSTCRSMGVARHYLTAGLQWLAWLLGKEEQARAPFASFSCPCRF